MFPVKIPAGSSVGESLSRMGSTSRCLPATTLPVTGPAFRAGFADSAGQPVPISGQAPCYFAWADFRDAQRRWMVTAYLPAGSGKISAECTSMSGSPSQAPGPMSATPGPGRTGWQADRTGWAWQTRFERLFPSAEAEQLQQVFITGFNLDRLKSIGPAWSCRTARPEGAHLIGQCMQQGRSSSLMML